MEKGVREGDVEQKEKHDKKKRAMKQDAGEKLREKEKARDLKQGKKNRQINPPKGGLITISLY